MAHFALLDENNVVVRVEVIANEAITDSEGVEQESLGIALLKQIHGADTVWKQTSWNTYEGGRDDDKPQFRYNYAMIGFTYNAEYDGFMGPKYEESFVLDTEKLLYVPPIPKPEPTYTHYWKWNEELYQSDTNNPKTLGWQRYSRETHELDPA